MVKISTPSEYRQELRNKILETASREFRAKGIKAVKMDDIANLLSVSKRTMYEIYDNKEQLLMESVKEEYYAKDRHMKAYIASRRTHVMDIILELYRIQMKNLADVNPVYFAELQKYPAISLWLEQRRQQNDLNAQLFFQQGIKEGFFRTDVNYALISKVGSGTIDYIMKNQLYKQYSLQELFKNIVMLFIRGFCTAKGIAELERQLQMQQ